ncbi:hypothetical protein GQ53DRAFT_287126 [Thozetella sp. PMI_491]|nr:hypothetical protein GQ53DRAFT_287126 [Thozetella sp. PMI_491]
MAAWGKQACINSHRQQISCLAIWPFMRPLVLLVPCGGLPASGGQWIGVGGGRKLLLVASAKAASVPASRDNLAALQGGPGASPAADRSNVSFFQTLRAAAIAASGPDQPQKKQPGNIATTTAAIFGNSTSTSPVHVEPPQMLSAHIHTRSFGTAVEAQLCKSAQVMRNRFLF